MKRKNSIVLLISFLTVFVVSSYNGCGNNGTLSGALDSTFGSYGLAATPVSPTQINLAWRANTESDLAGYRVTRDGVVIAMLTHDKTTFSSTGLSPATTYTFKIAAFDVAGNVSESAIVTATTFP